MLQNIIPSHIRLRTELTIPGDGVLYLTAHFCEMVREIVYSTASCLLRKGTLHILNNIKK